MATQVTTSSREVGHTNAPAMECFTVTQMFSEALTVNKLSPLTKINHSFDLNSLPQSILTQTKDGSDEVVASLRIDFKENRLVTYFQGTEKSILLSNALRIILDLSEIFSKIQSLDSLPSAEHQFTSAMEASIPVAAELTIDGERVVSFDSGSKRVVLVTSRGQLSSPMATIQSLSHLFNRQFVQAICPRMGLEPSIENLCSGIHKLYLGRCILGLQKIAMRGHSTKPEYIREFNRIVSLIKMPGSDFYTTPLA